MRIVVAFYIFFSFLFASVGRPHIDKTVTGRFLDLNHDFNLNSQSNREKKNIIERRMSVIHQKSFHDIGFDDY